MSIQRFIKIFTIIIFFGVSNSLFASEKYISNGELVSDEEKGFSIVPPIGWEVLPDYPSLSFMSQIPYEKGVFQRSIQLMVFGGGRYIDETSAKEFGKILTHKYADANPSMKDYSLVNYSIIELAEERPGIIYYTDFVSNNKNMMQAHLLLSSNSKHYLLTYTDEKQIFQDTSVDSPWDLAWKSMSSMKIEGETPSRFSSKLVYIISLILIIFLIVLFIIFKRRNDRKLSSLEDENSFDDDFDNDNEINGLGDDYLEEESDDKWVTNEKDKKNENLSDEEKEDFWKI